LFFAAQGGHLTVVQELLVKGAEIDLPSNEGGTPLFVSCQCNHLAVVKELVQRGANIHSRMKDGSSPLFVASQNGHLNVVKYLLSKGANVNQQRLVRFTVHLFVISIKFIMKNSFISKSTNYIIVFN